MKVLLDECIDRRFSKELKSHFVRTVPQKGWVGIQNGKLLVLAQKEFDAFVTVDRNLSFQQNLSHYKIAVVVLSAPSNRLEHLRPLARKTLAALKKIKAGEIRWIKK